MKQRELAARLGISPATLSLALNHKPGLSSALREQVLEGVRANGFENWIRALPTAAGDSIGFVCYKRHGGVLDRSPFFILLMESLEACAKRHGYNLLFTFVDRRNPLEEQIQRLRELDCRGLVVFATEMLEEDLDAIADLPYPVVLLDNDFPLSTVDTVAIDNRLATHQAISHLFENGHRRIGYLQSRVEIRSFQEREAGFREAMRHFGLELDAADVVSLDYTEENSFREFKARLTERSGTAGAPPDLPTAFVADDDTIAIGAMLALQDAGVSVPGTVSLVGINDRPGCATAPVPLTSIRVPKTAFGSLAVDLLVRRIRSESGGEESASVRCRVGTALVERASVAKPAAKESVGVRSVTKR